MSELDLREEYFGKELWPCVGKAFTGKSMFATLEHEPQVFLEIVGKAIQVADHIAVAAKNKMNETL